VESKKNVAVKILNPVGFKLMPSGPLKRCIVAIKGSPLEPEVQSGNKKMRADHVWWLVHPNTKQVIAAYEDPRFGGVRELPLPRCVEIWGWNPAEADIDDSDSEGSPRNNDKNISGTNQVRVLGSLVSIPRVSRKFINFLRSRRSIYR
jgi:hypothetical protein